MRPITDVLREYRKGRAVDLASTRLAELVQAVDETGLAGEITIKIKVKPQKGGGSEKTLKIDVKSKIPEMELPEAVFFSDQEGDLHRADPSQSEMFRDTSKPQATPAQA
jgi:ribosomal protein S28E/S33